MDTLLVWVVLASKKCKPNRIEILESSFVNKRVRRLYMTCKKSSKKKSLTSLPQMTLMRTIALHTQVTRLNP